jgi:hypothetical protein
MKFQIKKIQFVHFYFSVLIALFILQAVLQNSETYTKPDSCEGVKDKLEDMHNYFKKYIE